MNTYSALEDKIKEFRIKHLHLQYQDPKLEWARLRLLEPIDCQELSEFVTAYSTPPESLEVKIQPPSLKDYAPRLKKTRRVLYSLLSLIKGDKYVIKSSNARITMKLMEGMQQGYQDTAGVIKILRERKAERETLFYQTANYLKLLEGLKEKLWTDIEELFHRLNFESEIDYIELNKFKHIAVDPAEDAKKKFELSLADLEKKIIINHHNLGVVQTYIKRLENDVEVYRFQLEQFLEKIQPWEQAQAMFLEKIRIVARDDIPNVELTNAFGHFKRVAEIAQEMGEASKRTAADADEISRRLAGIVKEQRLLSTSDPEFIKAYRELSDNHLLPEHSIDGGIELDVTE